MLSLYFLNKLKIIKKFFEMRSMRSTNIKPTSGFFFLSGVIDQPRNVKKKYIFEFNWIIE